MEIAAVLVRLFREFPIIDALLYRTSFLGVFDLEFEEIGASVILSRLSQVRIYFIFR